MPKNRQITRPKQSSLPMPPPHSYTVMQFRSTPNEDDDDICPVCESECTCGNNNAQSSSTPQPSSTFAPTPLPLKIKLPARRALSPSPKSSTTNRVRPKSSKQNRTIAGSVTADGSHGNYVLVHRPGPFSILGHQLGTPPPAASTSTLSLRDSSPLTPEPELQPPSKLCSDPKLAIRAAAPKNRKKTLTTKANPRPRPIVTQKKKTAATKSRKKKDATWTGESVKQRGKRPAETSSDESEHHITEDEDAYITRMAIDSDGAESVHFPTFISAISTTSGNDDTGSITSDSFDSDSSVRAEEEKMILVEERARVRRELLNGDESWHMEKRKWDHLKNNNNWEIRPRKKSVGAEETESDVGSDSESDIQTEEEDEEEEGDDDDDDDADVRYGRGMVTGWQSDDDFDAELFFATLADSSGPGSDADAEDGEESGDEQSDNSDLSAISITEAAAAGLLDSPFGAGCPLVVTEDWDGRLVFANGLKDGQGVLDVHFEVDAAQRHRSIREAMEVDVDEMEESMLEGEEEEEDLISDDGGETTDDMLDHRPGINTSRGIVPLPFRCPTPPVTSIDPLSTLSPISGPRRKRLMKRASAAESPKPADILAGAGKIFWDSGTALEKQPNGEQSTSVSVAATSPPDTTASSSSCSRQIPSMGNFEHVPADPKRRAIIDGTKKVVFSPYTRIKRVRKHPARGRKRSAHESDIFPYTSKRPRQSSLPGFTRTPLPAEIEDPVQSSPELPISAPPIGLDDVLDAAFLDSDDSKEIAANTSGERHLRNLSRWDRIPMGTFRRSRATYMDENNVRTSALAPPNDGVSYGSAGGHLLRKTPLGVAFWQNNPVKNKEFRQPPGTVPVSPVIFPTRDGERTPTADQYPDFLQKPLQGDTLSSQSRKQKRKEKKRRRGTVHASPTPTPIPSSNGSFLRLPSHIPPLNL